MNIIRKVIRKNINKLFEYDYFPTFNSDDATDMEDSAKKSFVNDFRNDKDEKFSEPFTEPTDEEIKIIKNALYRANLDLPSDQKDVEKANEILDQQLSLEKSPEQIKRLKDVMEQLWGAGAMNEVKNKAPKVPKEPKITKSSSEKKKKEYKIKSPKLPKHES